VDLPPREPGAARGDPRRLAPARAGPVALGPVRRPSEDGVGTRQLDRRRPAARPANARGAVRLELGKGRRPARPRRRRADDGVAPFTRGSAYGGRGAGAAGTGGASSARRPARITEARARDLSL